MVKPEKGREWVKQKDPELYAATWAEPKIADPKLAALAKEYTARIPKALIAYIDKHPEVDWVVWRSGGRGNTRRLLEKHAEKYLGSYTYFDLYDLLSQVPAFPVRCLAADRNQDHRSRSLSSTGSKSPIRKARHSVTT